MSAGLPWIEPRLRRPRSSLGLALLAAIFPSCGAPLGDHPGVGLYGADCEAVTVCAGSSTVQGIDVSSWQGSVDWASVAGAGKVFGYTKATQGNYFQDSTFGANWSGMKANGLLRGAYHWLDGSIDGATQADYYLAYVGTLGGAGDLPPMLDWECNSTSCGNGAAVSNAQDAAVAQAFIDEIQAKTGLATIIYTDPGFWSDIGAPSQFAAYPFWVADYGPSCPDIPSPFSSFVIWQYSSTGSVPGVGGNVDVDEFNGTLAQLQALGNVSLPIAQQSGNDAITIVNWPDHHMDLFAKTPAGELQHANTTATGDTWTSFSNLDTGADCGSAAAFWGSPWTYPEVFSPLASGSTGHLWYTAGTGWNTYQSYGGTDLSHVATLVWLDGQTEVFALGSDGAIWHDAWDTSTTAWSGWGSLGGSFVAGVGTIMWTNGTAELFAVDASGGIWHSWSGTGTDYPNGWYAWTQFGTGMAGRPSPVRWADGHAEVFVRGTDGQLYHSDFDSQNGWPAFTVLSAGSQIIGDPSAIMNGSSGATPGPEVFARDPSGQVMHLWWNGSAYTSFTALGSQIAASDPMAWIRGDGNGEVFAIDESGNLTRTYRDPTTSWGSWTSIGTGFDACSSAVLTTTSTATSTSTGTASTSTGSTSGSSGSTSSGDTGSSSSSGGVHSEASSSSGSTHATSTTVASTSGTAGSTSSSGSTSAHSTSTGAAASSGSTGSAEGSSSTGGSPGGAGAKASGCSSSSGLGLLPVWGVLGLLLRRRRS